MSNLLTRSLLILLLACSSWVNDTHGATIIDQLGRQITVPENPQRVISLAPSITEIVFDLGQEKRLVGATQFSTYPDGAKQIPRVGSYVRLDLEKIIALKPDLCLAIKDGNPLYIIDRIEEMGIPVYVIDPRTLNQTIETIVLLGEVLQAQQIAVNLVHDMRKRIARIQNQVTGTVERPRVFFQIDADPIVSAGNNTFIQELIELAGGINTAAGKNPYPRFSWEDILHLQPDIVIISSMAGGMSPAQLRGAWQQWPQLTAVDRNRIHVVHADIFDRPTARLVKGLETLATIIHPEFFHAGE
jgi:iron complex transport system substrate-binding protein